MDANRVGRDVETAETGTIAAVFHDHNITERAVNELTAAGFDKSDIGIAVCQDPNKKMDEGWISRLRSKFSSGDREEYESTDAADTLRNMGIASDRTSHFERALHEGEVLVTVRAGSRQQQASAILQRNGGNLGTSGAAYTTENLAGGNLEKRNLENRNLEDSDIAGRDVRDRPTQRMQLFGEVLRVHKERVQRGEVRLHKEVVGEQKNIDVPVMHEEVVIERVASSGDRPVNAADFGKDQEIRVPVTEEKVRVDKTPVVNEEIRVGKRQVQDVQRVSDTVRHEEVKVDNEGDVNVDKGAGPESIRRDQKGKKIA